MTVKMKREMFKFWQCQLLLKTADLIFIYLLLNSKVITSTSEVEGGFVLACVCVCL